jgi:hypothetical protein
MEPQDLWGNIRRQSLVPRPDAGHGKKKTDQKTQERETELTGSFHRYTFFAFYFLCQRQMLFPVCNYYQLCYNLNDNMSKQPVQCQCIGGNDSGAQWSCKESAGFADRDHAPNLTDVRLE